MFLHRNALSLYKRIAVKAIHFVKIKKGYYKKIYLPENEDWCSNVLFLTGKKRTKRSQPKGRYENAPPLETPTASPSGVQKCSDF